MPSPADDRTALAPLPTPSAAGPRLTKQLAEDLVAGASTGLFRGAVAESLGLNPEWLDTWLEMGLSGGAVEPYRMFALKYRAAEQASQLPYIHTIRAAATVDYKAAIAWLQMRYPEQWGLKATKNTQAGALRPSEADEAAEEQLVDQLFETMPPVLQRVLARRGVVVKPPDRDPSED